MLFSVFRGGVGRGRGREARAADAVSLPRRARLRLRGALGERRRAAHLCVALAVLCAWPARPARFDGLGSHAPARRASDEEIDAALRRAALAALAGREGAILVLDAQTGRVRASADPQRVAASAFPPGSVVKPFTLLAALRARVVAEDSRLSCRKHFRLDGDEYTCAHPVFKPPFDAERALAHSCNYYFSRLGQRLDAAKFDSLLSSFGFGPPPSTANHADSQTHAPRTPTQATRPPTQAMRPPAQAIRLTARTARLQAHAARAQAQAPRLPREPWHAETALGEGGELLVTPLQLLAAYAALANGGRLYEPQAAPPANFRPRLRARVSLDGAERALLVAGMRGAVRYGTAEAARLDGLPVGVFGKTGTATELGGFRTHGWFVGFASDTTTPPAADTAVTPDGGAAVTRAKGQPAPSQVRLVVLVFLRRAQGRQAAVAARGVFEEYARFVAGDAGGAAGGGIDEGGADWASGGASQPGADTSQTGAGASRGVWSSRAGESVVRVRASREESPVSMPLEEYLFGVLAAEASTEDEFAALQAQAVVSRSYALRHAGRHAREGFDFCATTHCQRFLRVTQRNARPDFHPLLRRALSETAGETLRDSRGRVAAAYFSASCGGATADVETLWGTPAREPYERGVRDDACAATPHARWTDAIPARRLLLALREDPRSDVGSRLTNVTVARRDRTGRAALVRVEGERSRVLRGWDFKIIVGRTLGWSVLKSSRFTVERAGDGFVFRGSGFGHGLGLCQNGAHVLARRGAHYRQILAHYFPGASVARGNDERETTGRNEERGTRNEERAATGNERGTLNDERSRLNDERDKLNGERDKLNDERDKLNDETNSRRSIAVDSQLFVAGRLKSLGPGVKPASRARRTADGGRRTADDGRRTTHHSSFRAHHSSPRARRTAPVASRSSFIVHRSAFRVPTVPQRLTLSSGNFRASYPARSVANPRRDVEAALRTLEEARADALRRLAAASLPAPALPAVEVRLHETTADFVAATGEPAWVAAATRGARVELQPLAALRRRRVFTQTLRHELAHAFIDALSRGRAARWLTEGLAAHFAGEGPLLAPHAPRARVPLEELERRLARPESAAEMRALYAAAHREVLSLVRAEGEPAVWRRAARG